MASAHALAAIEARLPEAYLVDVAVSQVLMLPAVAKVLTVQQERGWEFAVSHGRGAGDHLRGTVAMI